MATEHEELNSNAAQIDPTELGFIGHSQTLIDTVNLLAKYARALAPVLICGETGTGKELSARAIHYLGAKRSGPFIPVNCASYPDSLFESAFFGHERGAFTDARERQRGLVSLAEGGTLFLDEIDCLSSKAQAVLLRFLQERQYRPLGGKREIHSDVGIICATNANLQQLCKTGRFRKDLYYRLDVATIELPPLRERREDIITLAHHFVRKLSAMYSVGPIKLSNKSEKPLLQYDWPGNIRELENVLHREYLIADPDEVELYVQLNKTSTATKEQRSRWEEIADPAVCNFQTAKNKLILEFEKRYTTAALKIADGNISHAARLVGKERRAFGRILKKHGISPTNAC